jgi:hypothetical protein
LQGASEHKIGIASLSTNEILDHLVTEVLTSVDTPPSTDVLYPTAKNLLADLAGRWLARQLNPAFRDPEKSPSFKSLLPAALKCVELEPDRADHHYRLAALQLVLDETEEALETLAEAQSKHDFLYESDRYYLQAIAQRVFDDLESIEDRKLKWAIAIVCTVKAIAAGGDWAQQNLQKEFKKTHYYHQHRLLNDTWSDITEQHNLLYKVLGLTESAAETQDTRSRAAARIRALSHRQD